MTQTAMQSLMTSLAAIVTGVTSMISGWVGVITASGNELLLFFVLVGFVGIGIGLLKRLTRV